MLDQSRTDTLESDGGWRTGSRRVFEPLEPRMLLSAPPPFDFYAVSGAVAEGEIILSDGSVDANGVVTGLDYVAGYGGPGQTEPISATMDWLDNGAFTIHEPGESVLTGAQFLSADGHSAGWFMGSNAEGGDFGFMIEKAQGVTLSSFNGQWAFAGRWNDGQDYGSEWGRFSVNNGQVSGESHHDDFEDSWTTSITETHPDGSARFSHGFQLFLSRDRQAMLIVNLDRTEEAFYEVAIRTDTAPSLEQIAGTYRFALGEEDESGNPSNDASMVSINPDGTWASYYLSQYDAGVLVRDDAGIITLDGNTARIQSTTDNTDEWTNGVFTADGGTFIIQSWTEPSGTFNITGLGVKISDDLIIPPTYEFSIGGRDSNADATVWELSSDDLWRQYDLADKTGSPAIDGEVVTWTDTKDGHSYAAGVSGGRMLLFHHDADGSWSYRDLSQATGGSTSMTGEIQVMTDRDGVVNITGLEASGDLIRFSQDGTQDGGGEYGWQSTDLGDQLRDGGGQMPAFQGDLVSYATTLWHSLNVVGLDADGAIWGVWWTKSSNGWQASNLSAITGAGALEGGLTVWLTSWGGMNIGGIDASGHLQATWWVPGRVWSQVDLTALIGGPRLQPNSISSFVPSWGAFNVAGVEQGTGDVEVYWWVPNSSWKVDTLSERVVGDNPPRITTDLVGVAATNSSLNVFGYDANADMIRYFWEPGDGGIWTPENLSEIAIRG